MGKEGCQCFLIATPTTATSRVKMLLWDCQCALIAWRHTFCLHCANGSSLLGCPVANTNRHSKTNGILIELWQHSLYGVCLVHICVCVCLCLCVFAVCALAFAGIYAKLCKEALVHFHWNTRNMSSQLPQQFPTLSMQICQLHRYVCVGVCGRGRGTASSWIFVLCYAKQQQF